MFDHTGSVFRLHIHCCGSAGSTTVLSGTAIVHLQRTPSISGSVQYFARLLSAGLLARKRSALNRLSRSCEGAGHAHRCSNASTFLLSLLWHRRAPPGKPLWASWAAHSLCVCHDGVGGGLAGVNRFSFRERNKEHFTARTRFRAVNVGFEPQRSLSVSKKS